MCHFTLVSDGLVYLGYTTTQYLNGISVKDHIRDVNIQIYRNVNASITMYRGTTVFTTSLYMQRGAPNTYSFTRWMVD